MPEGIMVMANREYLLIAASPVRLFLGFSVIS
jgi:hypothetical protein